MSNTNETNEFYAAMFGAYFPCKAKVTYGGIVNVESLHKTYAHISDPDAVDAGEVIGYTYIKPILTTLSAISDEDAVEVAKIIFNGGVADYLSDLGGYIIWYYFNVGHAFPISDVNRREIEQLQANNWVRLIDYLRSKSYDIGFRHYPSLIQSGHAIDSTTFNK